MNKGFKHGFLAGLLSAALVAGLGITAYAAGRTITIEDDIRVTVNGEAFVPRDANGAAVPLFTYNGTTYAPIRAICEAAGLTVDYDSSTRTAKITVPTAALPSTTPAQPSTTTTQPSTTADGITEARAREIALAHAGLTEADANLLSVKRERDDGREEYKVEFSSSSTKYEYEIDAVTGEIRSYEAEAIKNPDRGTANSTSYIDESQVKDIAWQYTVDRISGDSSKVTVVKCKLDRDNGRAIYEVELRNGHTEYECKINAATGEIISWKID